MKTQLSFALLLGAASFVNAIAADLPQLGSGEPGLKIATREPNAIVVYLDEPETVGVGLRGGYRTRKIHVLYDQGYGFRQERMEIPDQLYPFAANAAFTSRDGVRGYSGYEIVDGKVVPFSDVQERARKQYGLTVDEEFLGFVGGNVFFWKPSNRSAVHWRTPPDRATRTIALPEGIVDVYGVTKGIRGDVGISLLRKSKGLIVKAPREFKFFDVVLATSKIY